MDSTIHIGKEVDILSNKIKRKINNKVSKYGLTGIQGKIIGFIYNESKKRDIFQKDIEEEFNIRKSSVTSVIQLLEKKEFIKRISVCEDGRFKKLILTEKGIKLHLDVYKEILELEANIENQFTNEELEVFKKLLSKLNEKIKD